MLRMEWALDTAGSKTPPEPSFRPPSLREHETGPSLEGTGVTRVEESVL